MVTPTKDTDLARGRVEVSASKSTATLSWKNSIDSVLWLYNHYTSGNPWHLGCTVGVRETITTGYEENDFKEYLLFRRYLQFFISILGIILGLATLGTGAAQNATLAFYGTTKDNVPTSIALAYGAYYSFLLILTYVLAYYNLVGAGRKILDASAPLPAPTSNQWDIVYARRKNLEDVLQLRVTVSQSLQASVVIMAPLLSTIISVLLQ